MLSKLIRLPATDLGLPANTSETRRRKTELCVLHLDVHILLTFLNESCPFIPVWTIRRFRSECSNSNPNRSFLWHREKCLQGPSLWQWRPKWSTSAVNVFCCPAVKLLSSSAEVLQTPLRLVMQTFCLHRDFKFFQRCNKLYPYRSPRIYAIHLEWFPSACLI